MTEKQLKEQLCSLNIAEPETDFASIESRLGRQLSATPAMSKKRGLALGITGMAAVGAAAAIAFTMLLHRLRSPNLPNRSAQYRKIKSILTMACWTL